MVTEPKPNEWTIPELSFRLRVSESALRKAAERNRLTVTKRWGRVFVTRAEAERYERTRTAGDTA